MWLLGSLLLSVLLLLLGLLLFFFLLFGDDDKPPIGNIVSDYVYSILLAIFGGVLDNVFIL